MVNITKVYTKTGDAGETSLTGKEHHSKADPIIQAIGDVDELNALLGWCRAELQQDPSLQAIDEQCELIQQQLFNLGVGLCVRPEDRRADTPRLLTSNITTLEKSIDQMNESLSHLKSFILPGGGEAASRMHCVRACCRRAERSLVAAQEHNPVDPILLAYLNRLSDWCFVAARWLAQQQKQPETLWQATLSSD